jgi:acetolactate decarboxylase
MKNLLPILVMLILFACNDTQKSTDYTVHHYGALKNFMHKNDLSSRVNLSSFVDSSHVYGLGALEGLKGEILIWDGDPHMSTDKGGNVHVDPSFDYEAGLFVYSRVAEWQTITIPDDIMEYDDLENFIAQTAAEKGLDTTVAFPFLIDGVCQTLDWHVINWPAGDSVHTHQKHQTCGPHGQITDDSVDILGFYSNSHHAVFTHHTTNMHLHFKTKTYTLAGHVDGLTLASGKLMLPL